MILLAQANPPLWSSVMIAVGLWGFFGVWGLVLVRLIRGLPVLPYRPRRQVPWQGVDLLAILAAGFVGMALAHGLVIALLGPEATKPPAVYDAETSSAAHLISRLIAEGDLWVFLLCGLTAAVVAPVVEEFFFRVLLQGWLEASQKRLRKSMPTLRRLVPGAVGPILIASLLFARMHFRVDVPMGRLNHRLALTLGASAATLLTMAFAIGLLKVRVGATAADLGFSSKHFFADVRLGLLAFVGLMGPTYGIQLALLMVLPKYVAPDPFVLFPFAIVLGTLYYRTHRIVPAIVLHMALNTTSLVMAWLALKG